MTTILTSKMEELPPTSDTKMIDIWLIFCLLVPFAFTLIQTAIECYREDTTGAKSPEAWSSGPVEDDLVVCAHPYESSFQQFTIHTSIAGGKCSCKIRQRES